MGWLRRAYPFNAEQTVNILSEFGPLVCMFIVNAAAGITAGTWALLISTVVAMVVMRMVLRRFPVFPIIASSVTIVFGLLTIITGDPMWVQIKVSIFNAMFAGFLFGGLWVTSAVMGTSALIATVGVLAVGLALQLPYLNLANMSAGMPSLGDPSNPLSTNLICLGSLLVGFLLGGVVFRRNFFGYVFEKTFHYTREGWDRFTFSFAWFFVFTAVLNEAVRQGFAAETFYPVPLLGPMNGVNIWILFKIAFIMPVSGLYAWYLTRLMQKHRIPDEHDAHAAKGAQGGPNYGAMERKAAAPSRS